MPEKNEFINKIMNKNDTEIDSLLSYADGKKSDSSNNLNADDILDELLNSPEDSGKGKNKTTVFRTLPSVSSGTQNFHHVYFIADTTEYITYGSICEYSEEETAPVICDEAEQTEPVITEEVTAADISESLKTAAETPSSDKSDDYMNADEYDDISGFDRFCAEQENRHPKFYFILGLSIFLVVMLGIISCVILGLDAMRNFAESYRA